MYSSQYPQYPSLPKTLEENAFRFYVGIPPGMDKDLALSTALSLVRRHVRGATVYLAKGMWEGEVEDSLVIEIINPSLGSPTILARELKLAFSQESVLFVKSLAEGRLIS